MADAFDLELQMAVYRHFVFTGASPTLAVMRARLGAADDEITEGYRRLYARRLLVPAEDFASIRMAPPFSGVPTQHKAVVNGASYFANCAWDAFGVVSALGGTGEVFSRCECTFEPLTLHLTPEGPSISPWLFHCPVPAARWWQDIVFT
jgi:hypothetical protein